MIRSKANAEHYIWGERCHSWKLVESADLSVKQETLPPDSREQKHFHEKARQFFYVLKGTATFFIQEERFEVVENSGIEILPGKIHYIENGGAENLEILVISTPNTAYDRIELP